MEYFIFLTNRLGLNITRWVWLYVLWFFISSLLANSIPIKSWMWICTILIINPTWNLYFLALPIWLLKLPIHNTIYVYLFMCNDLFAFREISWVFYLNFLTTLTNGYFLLHPYFIYSGLICLIMFSVCVLKQYTRILINYQNKMSIIIKKNYINYSLYNFSIAILLGGWWALQELGWGGWWSWDIIEVMNLLVIITLLGHIHIRLDIFNLTSPLNPIVWVLSIHLFLRYNLAPSIHNFFLQLNECGYTISIIFILISSVFLNFTSKKHNWNFIIYSYMIFIYISLFFWFFFLNLIWNYLYIFNTINIYKQIWQLYILFIFIFISTYTILKHWRILTVLLISWKYFIIWCVIIRIKYYTNYIRILHSMLLTIMLYFNFNPINMYFQYHQFSFNIDPNWYLNSDFTQSYQHIYPYNYLHEILQVNLINLNYFVNNNINIYFYRFRKILEYINQNMIYFNLDLLFIASLSFFFVIKNTYHLNKYKTRCILVKII